MLPSRNVLENLLDDSEVTLVRDEVPTIIIGENKKHAIWRYVCTEYYIISHLIDIYLCFPHLM